MDKSTLIQLAVQQDELAWETLMRTYQQPVFRLAYLFTGDPDEAEDVTCRNLGAAAGVYRLKSPDKVLK